MPALPDVPAVLRIDMHFIMSNDDFAKCRFFLKYAGSPPTNTELDTLATLVRTEFTTNLAGLVSVDTSLNRVDITDLSSPTSAVGSDTFNVPGTLAGNVTPSSVCVLESLTISRRYRGGHPRIYWPFGNSTKLTDEQRWDLTFIGVVTTDLHNFYAGIEAGVWSGGISLQQVNVSYYQGFTTHTGTTGRVRNVSTPRTTPVVDVVSGDIVRDGIASQRKRLLRLA